MSEKIIRDPVHDVIAFRIARPLDRLLFELLGAPEMQRLRRIRQLGLATLAYPGADHSRFSHSLGTLQTARMMLNQLRSACRIDEELETACLAAALLHDVGHGPLSHVFERVAGSEAGGREHEAAGQRLILDESSAVHHRLAEFSSALPQRVVDLMQARPSPSFYSDILASQLDADRLDYLLRDNLMTGCQYGGYDLRWLLHAMTVDEGCGRLAIQPKGLSAVEAYLQSRYHMYRNVYFHKVVRSTEGMLRLALQRARRLAVQDRLSWPPREHSVRKALLGQQLTLDEFLDLDDVAVLHCFKQWTSSDDGVLAGLCRGLLFRRLYKTIDLSHLSAAEALAVVARARESVEARGGDADYELFYDEPSDTPYETYPPSNGAGRDAAREILIRGRDGALTEFAALSPFTAALSRQLMFRRLHVSEAWQVVRGKL